MLLLGACTAKSSTTSALEETEVAISQATPATIVPVSLEPPVDNCTVCHTDKQMLIDTALIVEEDAHAFFSRSRRSCDHQESEHQGEKTLHHTTPLCL